MKDVVAIIPARGGSKSIPKKNIRILGGFPMLAYSITAAKLSGIIQRVIVSTDSSEIADIAKKYGAEVPFLRPSKIAQDHSTDFEFFQHYLEFCRQNEYFPAEYLVHLRPTTPLRDISIIDGAIEKILTTPDATSLRSVELIELSPYKIFKMSGPYLKGFFPDHHAVEYYNLPRQHFPKTYKPNGYVDIVRKSTIDNGVLHGERMLGVVTDTVPDIDVKEDFQLALTALADKRYDQLIQYLKSINE